MKYKVTETMPGNMNGCKAGDIVEFDPTIAPFLLQLGYIEPLPIEEAKQDTQLRQYRRKAK